MDDWQRRPVRGAPAATYVAWPKGWRRRRLLRRAVMALAIGAAVAALLAWDLQRRGVPFTPQGLRWWLSLWWRP